MWWASISMAVVFSPPLGTMMSAFRLLGSTKASCMGLTVVRYCCTMDCMDDAVEGAAALLDVPHQTAQDALVGVGVHEDLIVEHGAQLRLHEGQDALHDEDGGRLDVLHLVAAVVVGVVVHRAVDGAAGLQLL